MPLTGNRNGVSFHFLAVDRKSDLVALTLALDLDFIGHATILARCLEAFPRGRNHRRNLESVERGVNAKDLLNDGVVVPRRGSRQPGVLCFAVRGSVLAGDHLRIDVGLATVQIADHFARRRIDARVVVVGIVAIANFRFRDHHPRIVVAEDPRVLFVSRWVRGNLAEMQIVARIGRLLQNNAVFGCEMFAGGFERLLGKSIFQADSGKHAEALRLDEDFAFRTFVRADLIAEIVISADEPLAVPTVLMDGLVHLLRFGEIAFRLIFMTAVLGNRRQFFSGENEEAGDEHRLGDSCLLCSSWSGTTDPVYRRSSSGSDNRSSRRVR